MKGEFRILNNRINWFESQQALFTELMEKTADKNFRGYITVNNVHTMMEGYLHGDFKNIINKSYLSLPDGKPLEIMGKLKGESKTCRLFGPNVLENCLDWGRNQDNSHFFFGGNRQQLDKIDDVVQDRFPGARIVGKIAPPFSEIELWDNEKYLEQINAAKPDFIWVGLGAPKQEKWMYKYVDRLDRGIMLGIGAGFSYLVGDTRHAPQWMKNASLEWLYRLNQEPARLWKRYLKTIPPFMLLAMFDLAGHQLRRSFSKP